MAVSLPDLTRDVPSVEVMVAYRTDSARTPVAIARYRVEVALLEGGSEVHSFRKLAVT